MKTLGNQDIPLEVTTDEDGNLRVFAGIESGFEGETTLYYTRILITLEKK